MTPPNGYYIASVNGQSRPAYVHVHDGVIHANDGNELRAKACSEFHPVSTQQFCAVWPDRAARKLDALTRLTLIAECLAADLRRVRPQAESVKAYDQLKP